MSSNIENDGLVGLENDDLDCDGLAMVVGDNCEFNFEGKSYRSYEDYVQAKRSRTAGIFADSGMLAARLAITEEMTAPGPRRAKNPRDDQAIPPLLPRRKSSRIARTVSEDPPLPEIIFPDAVHNFLADGLNLESLDSVITFHARMCNAEGCNGPCNHDGKIITGASFDSDDDEDELGPSDHLGDEDDSMEPAPVTASKPASEAMIAELKEKCINTINDKLATFPASLRGDFIERARTAVIVEKIYWCLGLCDYYTKSLMSGKTLKDVDRSKCPSAQFNDQILVRIAQMLATGIMFCNFRGECKRTPDGKNCMNPTPEEAIKIVEVIITFARLADALFQRHVAKAEGEYESIWHWNHHSERELASHVSLQTHQPTCLLHKRPPAVLGLQGLSPAAFVFGESFETVEDNGNSGGFDNHILPDAGVGSTFKWYQGS
jgi:hypothetical protein